MMQRCRGAIASGSCRCQALSVLSYILPHLLDIDGMFADKIEAYRPRFSYRLTEDGNQSMLKRQVASTRRALPSSMFNISRLSPFT